MGLGNNRDYVTTERRTMKTLQRHGNIMADLVTDGMEREQASKLALAMMKDKALLQRVYAERMQRMAK